MGDFLGVLRQHFRWAFDLSLESYEVLSDGRSVAWSDEDDRAIDLFKALLDTIDAIPPDVVGTMQELRDADPISFDKAMGDRVRAVRCGLSPANAAEFVEMLKPASQRNTTPVSTGRSFK